MSARHGSVEAILNSHSRIAVDSNVLIYLAEDDAERVDVAGAIVDAIADGRTQGVLSSAGLSEVLVGPARSGDGAGFERLAATIRDLGFRVVALDATTAEDAAWIRGQTGMSLPDAIHVACARSSGASAFVTNDRRITSRAGLEVLYLDDLTAAG